MGISWGYLGDKGLEAIANVDAYVETIDENGNIISTYNLQCNKISHVNKFN